MLGAGLGISSIALTISLTVAPSSMMTDSLPYLSSEGVLFMLRRLTTAPAFTISEGAHFSAVILLFPSTVTNLANPVLETEISSTTEPLSIVKCAFGSV